MSSPTKPVEQKARELLTIREEIEFGLAMSRDEMLTIRRDLLERILDALNTDGERIRRLEDALRWTLEWIDAVPADVADGLPTMPGFDRDYVDAILSTPSKGVG